MLLKTESTSSRSSSLSMMASFTSAAVSSTCSDRRKTRLAGLNSTFKVLQTTPLQSGSSAIRPIKQTRLASQGQACINTRRIARVSESGKLCSAPRLIPHWSVWGPVLEKGKRRQLQSPRCMKALRGCKSSRVLSATAGLQPTKLNPTHSQG